MNCIICGGATSYYFSKTYTEAPFDEFMRDIGPVDYVRCGACGFVLSATHARLPAATWVQLNDRFHHHNEQPRSERQGNQPPYAEQAFMIAMMGHHGLVDLSSMIDYAAGYGTLSSLLQRYCGIRLPLYDPYIQADGSGRYVPPAALGQYRTVINSAMFEHVLAREHLDAVNACVSDDGVLILHTVVCERVPPDPEWFYLRVPVHTAFHTNRSMDVLMAQWGYTASVYCPPSKCWVLYRRPPPDLAERVQAMNHELQATWYHSKPGFVDYWKGF